MYIYGLKISINYWGISSKELKEKYPDIVESEGTTYFRTEREARIEKDLLTSLIEEKYCPGYNEDGSIEITDYGTFSITIEFKLFRETYKSIKFRFV